MTMKLKFALLFILLQLCSLPEAFGDFSFIYNRGFLASNLTLDGIASYSPNGLIALTNATTQRTGHAFYNDLIKFKDSANSSAFSFSTTFVFAIISEYSRLSGHGIAFVIAPTRGLPGALPSQYLGLFNESNNGNDTNHVFAVELDTIQSKEFEDIDDNHVGIDINSLKSEKAVTAGYYRDNYSQRLTNLSLNNGKPMQVWVEYNDTEKNIKVTLAPTNIRKPEIPLLSWSRDLSSVLLESMYVGFSSSTGSVITSHYISGWSFSTNKQAEDLIISQLPKTPRVGSDNTSQILAIGLPGASVAFILALVIVGIYFVRRRKKFAEVVEDWERDYGPHRFKYKDLYIATNGFKDKGLLGSGGFGRVYKGVLPESKIQIAVKKVSHESRQGMKEFVAEIVSIGRMRHRNVVPLLGYCRRQGELLLVYDYMQNGSLDKYLYGELKACLTWSQRFQIIKGVASGLFYLHQGWEQVVVHRDIKASNVLLDGDMNGRLGDFGLARLYDHGTDPQTTHVVGTIGYLAPEHSRTGRATTNSDVYAFGAFLLEVVTGRRPLDLSVPTEVFILVDWVFSCWKRGTILEACDPAVNLGSDFMTEEVELVLKLGLICSNSEPGRRPSMRQVVQYLELDAPLPDLSSMNLTAHGLTYPEAYQDGFSDFVMSYPSSLEKSYTASASNTDSVISQGR